MKDGEWRYTSTNFLTSALDGGVFPAFCTALPPGKVTPIPTTQENRNAPKPVGKNRRRGISLFLMVTEPWSTTP
jgi:hypothetical protein